jgi:hypothetical protein
MQSSSLVTHRNPLKFVLMILIIAVVLVIFLWLFQFDQASVERLFNSKRYIELKMLFFGMISTAIVLLFVPVTVLTIWYAIKGVSPFSADNRGIQILDPFVGIVQIRWSEIVKILFVKRMIGKNTVFEIVFIQNKPIKKEKYYLTRDTNPIFVRLFGLKESVTEIHEWFKVHPEAASKIVPPSTKPD